MTNIYIDDLTVQALILYTECRDRGYTRVCWEASDTWETWRIGPGIVYWASQFGTDIRGGYYDPKDHGIQRDYQGFEPIEGKTLYL